MIDIPVRDIVAKICEQRGLSEEEVHSRIAAKLAQLGGLVTEDGAAHIVANELGVQILKVTTGEAKIRDLYPGMRSITVAGRVVRKFEARTFSKNDREGRVASFIIADETGQIRVTLWNDQVTHFGEFAEGEIVRVRNAVVKENRGAAEIHLNTDSRLEMRPEGVTITLSESGSRAPRERKQIKEITGDEENVEILATVVQLYDPRFFDSCSQCGKRLLTGESGPSCPTHGTVIPTSNYVVSAFLDDGTGNIRTTFWRQQTQRFLNKSDEEMLLYKAAPQAFEQVKTDLLGEIVKVVGKCKKNDTFDRIELTANLVFRDVDPAEELARIKSEPKPAEPVVPIEEAFAEPTPAKPGAKKHSTEELRSELSEEAISLEDLEDLDGKL